MWSGQNSTHYLPVRTVITNLVPRTIAILVGSDQIPHSSSKTKNGTKRSCSQEMRMLASKPSITVVRIKYYCGIWSFCPQ